MTKQIWIIILLFILADTSLATGQDQFDELQEKIEKTEKLNSGDVLSFLKSYHVQKHQISAQGGSYSLARKVPEGYLLDFNYNISREFIFEQHKGEGDLSTHLGFRYNRSTLRASMDSDVYFLSFEDFETQQVISSKPNRNSIGQSQISLPAYVRFNNRARSISIIAEAGTLISSVKRSTFIDLNEIRSWELKGELLLNIGIAFNISDKFMLAPVYDVMNGFVIKAETRL